MEKSTMTFDYSRLTNRINEVFKTQSAFAKAMKLSEKALASKLSGRKEFTADEIRAAVKLLGIPADEVHAYFFTLKD